MGESCTTTEYENSFLHETTFNSDIDSQIRFEIERKYKRSTSN